MNEEYFDNVVLKSEYVGEAVFTETPDFAEHNTGNIQENGEQNARSEKKTALLYLLFALAALASIYVVQLFRFTAPLFANVHQGDFTTIFYYGLNVAFWIPAIALLSHFIKKTTGYRVFHRGTSELSLRRSLVIYAMVAVPIFIVSAVLGFELKVVFELGTKLNTVQVATNGVMYAHGAVKLLLAVMIIELVQEAFGKLVKLKFKYAEYIPWGGIVLALTFGLLEVLVTHHTPFIPDTFSWLYFGFDLLYGIIYVAAKKNTFVTYFTSLILFIL